MIRNKFIVEFIIQVFDASLDSLEGTLTGLGENLELKQLEEANEKGGSVAVRITTDDPYFVFDTCSEFGRLKSVKVSEIEKRR